MASGFWKDEKLEAESWELAARSPRLAHHAARHEKPCDLLIVREIARELLGQLPEAQAEALAMHLALGHSIEEVAAAVGAPGNTVRSRIRLAKEALRARIDGDPRLAELLATEGRA